MLRRLLPKLWEYACILISSIIICSCAGFLSAWGVPPSPAGGNYLALDGEDDYAVLDFETFGALFEKGTRELTVETWIYPTLAPEKDAFAIILSQQVVFYVVGDTNPIYQAVKNWPDVDWEEGDLLFDMRAYEAAGAAAIGYRGLTPISLSPHKWHHIAFQAQNGPLGGQRMLICDGRLLRSESPGVVVEHDLSKMPLEQRDSALGGYERETSVWGNPVVPFWGYFAGYIDEARFSKVPRYDVTKRQFTPQGRFEPDADTVALWHFDEHDGANIFHDSSGNEYHLAGKNGAAVGTPLAVNGRDKLATTWAAIRNFPP